MFGGADDVSGQLGGGAGPAPPLPGQAKKKKQKKQKKKKENTHTHLAKKPAAAAAALLVPAAPPPPPPPPPPPAARIEYRRFYDSPPPFAEQFVWGSDVGGAAGGRAPPQGAMPLVGPVGEWVCGAHCVVGRKTVGVRRRVTLHSDSRASQNMPAPHTPRPAPRAPRPYCM